MFMGTTIKFSVSILPMVSTPVVRRLSYSHEYCLTPFKVSAPQVDSKAQVMSDLASALETAEHSVTRMKPGPQDVASTLDTAVNIGSSDSFSAAYNTMVENVEIFANAVDKLAEVSK